MVDTTFITNKGTDTLENHFKTFMKNTKVFSGGKNGEWKKDDRNNNKYQRLKRFVDQ